jgi:hypothetical protein
LSGFLRIIHSKIFVLRFLEISILSSPHALELIILSPPSALELSILSPPHALKISILSPPSALELSILSPPHALEISILSSPQHFCFLHALVNSNNVVCPYLVRFKIYLIGDGLDVW